MFGNQYSHLLAKSQGDFVERQDIRSDVIYRLSWDEEEPGDQPEPDRVTSSRRREDMVD